VSPDPFSKATFPSTPARLPEKGGGFFVWSVVLRSNAASSLRLCGRTRSSGFLKSLGEPHLDEALAGHTDSIGGMIEAFDHPAREVDIHLGGSEIKPFLVGSETLCRGEIEVIEDVGSRVGHGIKLFRS